MLDNLDPNIKQSQNWDTFQRAYSGPKIYAKTDSTISFQLGVDGFGWSFGSQSKGYTGTRLDITNSTVRFLARKLPRRPDSLDLAAGFGFWNGNYGLWDSTTSIEKTATITDASNGEVGVELDTSDTDTSGDYIAEIEITDNAGKIIRPGQMRLTILKSMAE